MLFEDVHANHSFVKLWIQRLDDFIVKMLLQMQKREIESSESYFIRTRCTEDSNIVLYYSK